MKSLLQKNHDFMYQSSLIFAETANIERSLRTQGQSYSHNFHNSCECCIRPIYDIKLTGSFTYHSPDRSNFIKSMCGMLQFWTKSRAGISLNEEDWDLVYPNEKSFHIGTAQGRMFGMLTVDRNGNANEGSLFPHVVGPSLMVSSCLKGVLRGLYSAASYNIAYQRSANQLKHPKDPLEGAVLKLIHHLSRQPSFLTIMTNPVLLNELKSQAHRIPPTYTPSRYDISSLIKTYFTHHVISRTLQKSI